MQSFEYAYVNLEPSEQIGLHEQPSWELSYIVKGSGVRMIGGDSEEFESGDVALIPPGLPHCWYFDKRQTDERGRISNVCILIAPEQLRLIAQAFPILGDALTQILDEGAAKVFSGGLARALAKIMMRMREESAEERAVSLLAILVLISNSRGDSQSISFSKVSAAQVRINQIRTYVICNFQRNFCLEDLARHLGMNRSSLCVFMKHNFGMTFTEYVNAMRLDRAKALLKNGELPIGQIAYEAGFNNINYFNRLFKREFEVTPKEWRDNRPRQQ